jgi:hypothetical protein
MAGNRFDNVPPPPGLPGWNEIPFARIQSDSAIRLVGGTAITDIGGFGDLNLLERRVVTTISEGINRERSFTSSTDSVSTLKGAEFVLADVWRPKGFQGRIADGVAYVQPFDQAMATRYKLSRHIDKGDLCLPLLIVGVLESRGRRLSAFVGSTLYHPLVYTSHGVRHVGYPITRRAAKPLNAIEIDELVRVTNVEAIEIGRRLAAAAMQHPFSGGGMSGGKRSKV